MKIEKGFDLDGNDVWFVLNGADLVGMYYTFHEAQLVVNNE